MIAASGVLAVSSSPAGIVGSVAGTITALTALVVSITVLIPQLKAVRKTQDAQTVALGVIHTLVNSTLTASIESDLEATKLSLATMAELVSAQRAAGREPTPQTLAMMETSRLKIDRLTQQMADRLHSAESVLSGRGNPNPVT